MRRLRRVGGEQRGRGHHGGCQHGALLRNGIGAASVGGILVSGILTMILLPVLYDLFTREVRTLVGADRVATGIFRAMMQVELINDGPVTLLLESR